MESSSQAFFAYEFLQQNNSFLNYCHSSKLLSTLEINEIHKKRLKFEQQIASINRATRKNAYLRYLTFELNLLQLVEMRFKQLSKDKKDKKEENGDALFLFINYIVKIFLRACTNHPQDIVLWKSALDFSIKYNVRVREVMNRALKLNTQSADLWLICAKWYAEFSGQPRIARNILQRAIRNCPGNQILWSNFFEMECYLSIPSAEEIIESPDFDASDSEMDQDDLNNKDYEIKQEDEEDSNEEEMEDHVSNEIKVEDENLSMSNESETNENGITDLEANLFNGEDRAPTISIEESQKNSKLRRIDLIGKPEEMYAVPIAIMDEILNNSLFKDNVEIRFILLEILKKFPHTEEIQKILIQNIITNFADNASALFKCIKFNFSIDMSLNALTNILNRIHSLVLLVNSEELWFELIEWCLSFLNSLDINNLNIAIQFLLEKVFNYCNNDNNFSPRILCKFLDFLDLCQRTDLSVKITKEAMKKEIYSSNKELILKHILLLKTEKKSKKVLKYIQKLAYSSNNALKEEVVWQTILNTSIALEKDTKKVIQLFKQSLQNIPDSHLIHQLFYRWSWIIGGKNEAAKVQKYILSLTPVPITTYLFLLDEISRFGDVQLSLTDEIFEKALLEHGKTSPELWIRKIKQLKLTNRSLMIGIIRNRALNTVEDINTFEELDLLEFSRDD